MPGHVGHDRPRRADERVEERRLSGVGAAEDRDPAAGREKPAGLVARGQAREQSRAAASIRESVSGETASPTSSEKSIVAARPAAAASRSSRTSPRSAGEPPLQPPRREPGGRLRPRFDQVPDGLGVDQIDLAETERALRELARPRRPRSRGDERGEHPPGHDGAAVDRELRRVLARRRSRRGKVASRVRGRSPRRRRPRRKRGTDAAGRAPRAAPRAPRAGSGRFRAPKRARARSPIGRPASPAPRSCRAWIPFWGACDQSRGPVEVARSRRQCLSRLGPGLGLSRDGATLNSPSAGPRRASGTRRLRSRSRLPGPRRARDERGAARRATAAAEAAAGACV